jgi:hypothetical protein
MRAPCPLTYFFIRVSGSTERHPVSVPGGCDGNKKENQRQGKAPENARHQGGHAQEDYDGQKNQGNQKESSEEGAPWASITQESQADCEGCGQADAGQPAGTARSGETDAEPARASRSARRAYRRRDSLLQPLVSRDHSARVRSLRLGDMIHVRGHTTDFSQKVESIEVKHAPATEVGSNEEFGLKVVEHAREHDVVFKVRS